MTGSITKRVHALADGRELIYFDDADTTLPPERAARRARARAPRPPTATMRQDPLTGEWISIAAARQNRVVPAARPSSTRSRRRRRATRPRSRRSYDVAVFENQSPSFGPGARRRAGCAPRRPRRPRRASASAAPAPRVGRCEVVCFSPDTDRLLRHAQPPSRARTVDRGVGRPHRRAVGAARRRAGVPVREPRRGDRRHAAPPARPDLRLPLRHAAHQPAARRRSTRYGPDLFADILAVRAGGPSGCVLARRALDRVRAVRRALADRGAPAAAPPRRRLRRDHATPSATSSPRSTCGCCAASTRSTTPRRPTSRPGTRRPVHVGRDDVRLHLQLTSPAPRAPTS